MMKPALDQAAAAGAPVENCTHNNLFCHVEHTHTPTSSPSSSSFAQPPSHSHRRRGTQEGCASSLFLSSCDDEDQI